MPDKERWLPVVGYEKLYEVSDQGRVKRTGRGAGARVGRILGAWRAQSGRLWVGLWLDGRQKTHQTSRLVASAFLCPVTAKDDVHHVDDDPANNLPSNLRVMPHSGHTSHHHRGERARLAKLTVDKVRAIKKQLAQGQLQCKIASAYSVSRSAISLIKVGRTWKHVS